MVNLLMEFTDMNSAFAESKPMEGWFIYILLDLESMQWERSGKFKTHFHPFQFEDILKI